MRSDTMQETVKLSTYLDALTKILSQIEVTSNLEEPFSIDEGTQKVIDQIISIKFSNKKIMVIGNGGSAAIASHMHNDLCKSVNTRAMVFYEPPLLTAFSNDLSYTVAFENLINLWADNGDMLIAISSSGQSENILRAAKMASVKGSTVVTLSGFKSDNPLRYMGCVNFYVPSCEYGFVELIHSVIAHYLSDAATTKCK
jgi:D-sedoheptulose 7-phosphate isomerase